MTKFLTFILLIFASAAAAAAQDVAPVATPTLADEADVVKISTNLIQIDVTVTDSKGKVITDLRPDEVEIYENGKRQKTSNFSFVSNVRSETRRGEPAETAPGVPGMPPPPVKPENVRRTIALVVDDLNMSFSSTVWVRDALKKFVNEQMQDGDLVAVIRTGAGIGTLQQFTNDKRLLLAAISKVRFNMLGSGSVTAFNPIEPSLKEQVNGSGDGDLSASIERDQEFDRDVKEFRESIFASGTLGAVNYVVRGMMSLPGRKSIMLLSDGFSFIERDAGGRPTGFSRVLDPLRNLTDLANRASVVIYAIDPRGLEFTGLTAADNIHGLTQDEVNDRLIDRDNALQDTQDGLIYLSRETGGYAVVNQNDILGSMRRIMRDQSYYLVGYQPDDESFDPKARRYNKLEVKVLRKGARARYRSGFFGISDEDIARPAANPRQTLFNALTSPFAVNDITLRLNALYNGRDKSGEHLKSFLHIDAHDLTFAKQPDGGYKTSFDVLAVTYGDNGLAKDRISKNYTMTLNEAGYSAIKRTGLVYDFTLLVKNSGAYQMRVAIRDTATNKAGSASQFIEIPNLKKNRLALSGVMLRNTPLAEWKKRQASAAEPIGGNPMSDTAIRQFSPGTVLDYGLTIYNAKPDAARGTALTVQTRLFSDQKQIFESNIKSVDHPNAGLPAAGGSILLGAGLAAGNYTLQLIVTDVNAKKGRNTAVQFVPFEVVR